MNRLLVILLAAFDALIAAVIGVAVCFVPLLLLWVFESTAWGALWPTTAAVWQLGHLVPLTIHLPGDYLAAAGIAASAASFTLSLAPLALASFTAIFAARSGCRATRAGSSLLGPLAGAVAFGALAAVVCFTARTGIAAVHAWQAVLFPALVFGVSALIGSVVTAWREGDDGVVDRVHDRVDALPDGWRDAPGTVVRGAGVALSGLIGIGALAVAVATTLRGGQLISLYETGNMNVIGVVVTSLAQLAYLPTLVVWGISFVAGPGFAIGTGTAVSPAGTQLGVVPGIPALGLVPASTSPWLLVIVVLPIAVGAFAGWAIRSRLAGLEERDHYGVHAAVAVGIAVVTGAGIATLASLASGSIGPGRLVDVGPDAGAVALAVGVEVFVGAAILLLSPRSSRDSDGRPV
jgi:hypothetical protein